MTTSNPKEAADRKAQGAPDETIEDEGHIAGMGGGIAGPSEPGAAGTPGGEIAIGGETSATSKPSREDRTGLADAVAEAFDAVRGQRRQAVDENADQETGSPGIDRR